MGNTNHSNSGLKIYIETEKEFYNSGSSIEGVVFIEADKDFNFNALYIRIQGDEWCQWFEGSSKNRVKYTGNDHFYVMEYLLQVYKNQTLEKGSYAYPFSIQLSENIPGSFQSVSYDAKISYQLLVYLVDYTNAENRQSLAIPLLIRQPFRQEMAPYEGSSASNPNTFGCFSHGEVALEARFERNVCFQGQKVQIDYTVDNTDGDKQVQKAVINLVQYTFIAANSGVSRTYKNIICANKIGEHIPKGHKLSDSYSLIIPTVSHQTAISTLVANYYRIQITVSLGIFSSDNPSVYAPLFILKKSLNSNSSGVYHLQFNPHDYKTAKPVLFRAPDYCFRKNRNLSVMNFKIQDIMSANGQQFTT